MSPIPRARQREIELAQIVERLMVRDYSVDPGPRTIRDARDSSGLTVDFTYDLATRPLAVEVTSPQDPHFAEAMAKIGAAERKLTKLAEAEGWGSYAVGVYEHANANKLQSAIAEAIREMIAHGREKLDIDYNYGDDYHRARNLGVAEEFQRRHEVLRGAGLQLIYKVRAPGQRVRIIMVRGGVETGFIKTLDQAINNNRLKLARARGDKGRQTHLIVDVTGLMAPSPNTIRTTTPSLNHDVDMIWVVNDGDPKNPYPVWSVRRGDSCWRFHEAI